MRLIDADALIADCQLAQKQADRHGREYANAFYSGGGEISTEWWCVEDMIENAPTIEERKKGKWIWDGESRREYPYKCSECGEIDYYAFLYDAETRTYKQQDNFCPNCGAKMEGE